MVKGTQKSSQFVEGAFPLTNQTIFFILTESFQFFAIVIIFFLCEVEAALFLFFLLDSFPNFASYFSIKASNSTMTDDQFDSALLQAESAIDPMYTALQTKIWHHFGQLVNSWLYHYTDVHFFKNITQII